MEASMNDKSDLDLRQSQEVVEGQSEEQIDNKQLWTTPTLKIIDINAGTESGLNIGGDGSATS